MVCPTCGGLMRPTGSCHSCPQCGATRGSVTASMTRDFPFYARAVLKVRDRGRLVPFALRPAQLKLWTVLEAQRARRGADGRGRPEGPQAGDLHDGAGPADLAHDADPLHHANVIAHNSQTAGAIMEIAELMYATCRRSRTPS
jgi:hypothetical protein